MGAVWFIARSGAARRALAGIVLAALVGVAGGVVLTAWAGARRTDTAYARLSAAVNHPDLVVTPEGDPSLFDPSVAADGPGVAATGAVRGYAVAELRPDGTVDIATIAALLAPVTTTAWYDLDRSLMAEGRPPDPEAADEIIVAEAMRDAGYPIGTVVDLCLIDFNEVLAYGQGVLEGTATFEQQRAFAEEVCAVHHMRVVGVTRLGPDEVVLREDSEADLFMLGSPALAADAGQPHFFSFVLVDLEPGADEDAYVNDVLDRTPPEASLSVQSASLRATVVDRTIEPYVRALVLFAIAAAVAAIGVLGPAIVRWAGTPESDRASLLALGLRSHQLRLASALRGAALGIVAAAGAVAIAFGVSGRFPIGVAARIEPYPGVRIDGAVLAVGAVAIVLLSALLGAVATTSPRGSVRRPSRVAQVLQAWGLGHAAVAGVRAALSGDGRGVGAVRTAGGVAVAIAAVVTALTYQAGLSRLLDTPERYGWTWDTVLEAGDAPITPELLAALDDEPSVTALSAGYRTALLRDGAAVQMFAFDPVRGGAYPRILEGRAPRGDAEIALGGQTLDRLGVGIGDQLTFRGPNGDRVELRVVGQTLLPLLSLGQDLSVAEGGLIDVALHARISGDEVGLALIDVAPGTTLDDLQAALDERGVLDPTSRFQGPTHTADLRGYDAVRRTPLLLAGVLALLGLGVLAHTITTSARRRARELALLRCIGFSGRDLRTTVRWNALAVVGLCIAVAVPLGVGLGRTLWSAFAGGIGLVDDPVTPIGGVTAVVAVTIAGALALSVIPGRRASQARPAAVLRSE